MEIYLISDTHFNHGNVIKYCDRPFENVQEMNENLIKIWNSVVTDKDLVIFLGDFCLGKKEEIPKLASQLNGIKVIILGNHDRNKAYYMNNGFVYATKSILLNKELTCTDKDVLLTHKPQLNSKCYNIHGHIHNTQLSELEDNRYFNVSCEAINYTPIKLTQILNRWRITK